MEENSRVKRRKMQYPILGRYWAENAEILENKGIPRFSFRFESTSAHQVKPKLNHLWFDLDFLYNFSSIFNMSPFRC